MLVVESLTDVKSRILQKQDFVLNIIAEWCPDCMEEQKPIFHHFVEAIQKEMDVPVIELLAQIDKRVFLNAELEEFVEGLGGHGFPRTVLFKSGIAVDSDNVEFISLEQLNALAAKFVNKLKD